MSLLILLLGDLLVAALGVLTLCISYVCFTWVRIPEPYCFIGAIVWSCYPMVMSVVRQIVSGFYHVNDSTTYKEDLCKTFLTKQ